MPKYEVVKSYIVTGDISPQEAAQAVETAGTQYQQLPVMTIELRRTTDQVTSTVESRDLRVRPVLENANDF